MNLVDVIIIAIAVVVVVGTIVLGIINKKKGKTSCGCNCAECSKCSHCPTTKNQTHTQNNS